MRKYFLIATIVLLLIGLTTIVTAPTTEPIGKSGTTFTLLSNTNQCLSNCEAWIEWDLTKGITSDVLLPNNSTALFGFETIKNSSKTQDLDYFNIEVWKDVSYAVPKICSEDTNFTRVLDLNETCKILGCVDGKDIKTCTCSKEISVECGTKTEIRREKIADSFYGFTAKSGEIYLLRVVGKRKAVLGENNIDWQPTFFGEKITEWAWWNSDWESKYAINDLVIPKDFNSTNWINVSHVNFSTLNIACADADDFTVVNETDGTEVSDMNLQGWNGTSTDADVNVLFKLTESLSAGTYDGEYYFYMNNAACGTPTNRTIDQSAYDDFEDGDSTTKPMWYLTGDGTANNTATIEASAAKEGSYGWKWVLTAGGYGSYAIYTANGYANTKPYKVCTWLRVSDVSLPNMRIKGNNAAGTQQWQFGLKGDKFYAYSAGPDDEYTSWATIPADNTWYKYCVSHTGTVLTFTIYSATESFIEAWVSNNPPTAPLAYIIIGGYGFTSVETISWDNLSFGVPSSPTYSLGEEEISSSCTCPVSGDWVIINGDECTLSTLCEITGDLYVQDGNLTITSTGTLVYPSNKKVFWKWGHHIWYDLSGGKIKTKW